MNCNLCVELNVDMHLNITLYYIDIVITRVMLMHLYVWSVLVNLYGECCICDVCVRCVCKCVCVFVCVCERLCV